ncbi:hypothetical protein [Arthrobacter sp. zg-Y1110]|uniref:hypothetical protein n=1 Tax=Arthrobacter sp. zg-Y1110 TaxID=2886932 RepID=UPI001D152AFD|nr:hypothetical protein [Arthrobacter sp. zg-Y1110]MCC3291023.1 hypothetical protein [Arthrobacter sp. zg-Y1110]UWX86432.1 hypothetical protein N2K99_07950 [Arthrobacter sp. zg-Y1110]
MLHAFGACNTAASRRRDGKVDVILTGVVLGEARQLDRICALPEETGVVRPQNYFCSPSPLLWHACRDTGRTLVNPALGAGAWKRSQCGPQSFCT